MVDQVDRQIILALKVNPRRPNADIAREVGVSEATVRRRIEGLLQQGIVRVALLPGAQPESRSGLRVSVLMGIRCRLSDLESVAEALRDLPSVQWLGRVIGRYDLVAQANFADQDALRDFYLRVLPQMKEILHVDLLTVMDVLKAEHDWEAVLPAPESKPPSDTRQE